MSLCKATIGPPDLREQVPRRAAACVLVSPPVSLGHLEHREQITPAARGGGQCAGVTLSPSSSRQLRGPVGCQGGMPTPEAYAEPLALNPTSSTQAPQDFVVRGMTLPLFCSGCSCGRYLPNGTQVGQIWFRSVSSDKSSTRAMPYVTVRPFGLTISPPNAGAVASLFHRRPVQCSRVSTSGDGPCDRSRIGRRRAVCCPSEDRASVLHLSRPVSPLYFVIPVSGYRVF